MSEDRGDDIKQEKKKIPTEEEPRSDTKMKLKTQKFNIVRQCLHPRSKISHTYR